MSEPTPGTPQPSPIQKPDRTWDILCHISALAGFVIPFGNVFGPLVVWLIKRDQMPSVNEHGKEALNFQISVAIYAIIAWLTVFILIGFILLPAVIIGFLVLTIIATVKASNGEFYRYPFTIRFIS